MTTAMIGLEIHGYLNTNEKLFCNCKAERHASKKGIAANSNICPICTGQPGSKPMLPNSEAIKKIIQISLMLGCRINTTEKLPGLVWQRKHYSWPDLPKGYQNTLSGPYSNEVGIKGEFEGIKIRECHLEEDPAQWNPETGNIDYNRSGLPLIEMVTDPDFKNSEEVIEWLKELVLTLSYIKALDKNAGIKADVNVSINGGERVEIKNITSLESIKKAIDYEIYRQEEEGAILETRRFDEESGKTILMRKKEQAEDYRFIPDPDLPILKLSEKEVDELKKKLPQTPKEKLENLIKKHKIDKKNAEILHKNFELVEFFEEVAEKISPEFALSWVNIELLRVLNWNKKTLEEVDIKPEHFIELLTLVKTGKLTELKAKQILNEFVPHSFSPQSRLKENSKIEDEKEIEAICRKVIEKNAKSAEDYKQGKKEAFNFLMGEVMKESNRRADFLTARKVMEKILS